MYRPESPPSDSGGLLSYLWAELGRIGDTFARGVAREVEFLNVAPAKPREGMVCGADGTNWNPGAGKGVYCYYDGTWNRLG